MKHIQQNKITGTNLAKYYEGVLLNKTALLSPIIIKVNYPQEQSKHKKPLNNSLSTLQNREKYPIALIIKVPKAQQPIIIDIQYPQNGIETYIITETFLGHKLIIPVFNQDVLHSNCT